MIIDEAMEKMVRLGAKGTYSTFGLRERRRLWIGAAGR